MRIHSGERNAQCVCHLLRSKSVREGFKNPSLCGGRLSFDLHAARTLLSLSLQTLCLLRVAERLQRIVHVCAKRRKWTAQELYASSGWCMHYSPFVRLLFERVW